MTRRCPPRTLEPKRAPVGVPREPFSTALEPDEIEATEPARVPPDLDDTIARSASDGALPFPPMFGPGPMFEHGSQRTNDLETFRAFFGSLGVPFEEIGPSRAMPASAVAVLWVAGASFAFDSAGTFLGISRTGQAATFIARKS